MHCVFLKGRVALTARHLLADIRLNKESIVYIDNPNLNAPYSIPLKDVETRTIKTEDGLYKDLVFLIFPDAVHAHKDITGMFNSRSELENLGVVNGQLTCYDLMGSGQQKLDMLHSMSFVIHGRPKTGIS